MSNTNTKLRTNGINGNIEPAYTDTESRTALLKEHGDTSKAIRALLKSGKTNGQVAKLLNIRPQHVFNVSRQVLKSR